MSWLLFMDESGHDHQTTPYEVRGGVALHASKIWSFLQSWKRLELDAFGGSLALYKKEIKGCKLLAKDHMRFAAQATLMPDEERRKHCRGFLTKGLEKKRPSRDEFTRYGQACLEMARGIFQLLRDHDARVFAAVIPCRVSRPNTRKAQEFLRKDQVFLLERYFYFLEEKHEHGLLVMDETDKSEDRRFVRRLQDYFQKSETGRYRTAWIVPSPFFVASDMAEPVQAADLCCYVLNWGFRLPAIGMNEPTRPEIETEFSPWLRQIQYTGQGYRHNEVFDTYGIVYVPDPYSSRQGR